MKEVALAGLALNISGAQAKAGARVELPRLPNPAEGKGFTIDFWVKCGRRGFE